jgi:multisubunit Na+/H+ antiporter MnhF subunit
MVSKTYWVGLALVVLGIVGFVGSGAQSLTALIPSVIGAILAGLGFAARQDSRRKLMIHIAIVIALIGFLGSIGGLTQIVDLITGDDVERPWAVAVQSVMAVVLLGYLIVAIKSFVDARTSRNTV